MNSFNQFADDANKKNRVVTLAGQIVYASFLHSSTVLDSRLRGNDGEGNRNDGEGNRNDGEKNGNDANANCRKNRCAYPINDRRFYRNIAGGILLPARNPAPLKFR
jgi:hypothetical protein